MFAFSNVKLKKKIKNQVIVSVIVLLPHTSPKEEKTDRNIEKYPHCVSSAGAKTRKQMLLWFLKSFKDGEAKILTW